MPKWFWLLPWIIPVLLPLLFVYRWRQELSNKFIFFVVSCLAAFGVAFIALMLAGLILDPLLRVIWNIPQHELLGKNHPISNFIVAAFHLLLNVGLLVAVMYGLRKALRK